MTQSAMNMTYTNLKPAYRIRFRTLLLGLVLLLPHCVTTVTGGYVPTASEEEALQNYVRLAVEYYNNDDMVNARRHINNALAINDRSSEVYNVMALVNQREGDLELADESFRRAISLDAANSRARNNYAAFLFAQERYRDAYDQLEIVANDTEYTGRAIAFENLGRAALSLQRLDDAERAFQRALQLNNNLYLSTLELAQLRYDRGNLLAAKGLYDQYLTIKDFAGLPFTPRSLWIGIQIERALENDQVVEGYVTLLSRLYEDSPEYQLYQNLVAND